jgi:5'(3')-deoxyribonucleotidase
MKRILVDMDGVLADVYHRFKELHHLETGTVLSDAVPNVYNWVTAPGFFRHLPLIEGSRKGLEMLNKTYHVVVVSMATEYPNCLTDKQLWLEENYPFISWKQVVLCGDKSLIHGDLMIDDHLKNLDYFSGETFIFSQPHNLRLTGTRHRRVHSWKEIEDLLLPEYR